MSPIDRMWGIGFDENLAGEKRDVWGMNQSGRALMTVKKRLREESRLDANKEVEIDVEDDYVS